MDSAFFTVAVCTLDEYNKKSRYFHDTLNESVLLINAFHDNSSNMRKENILQAAQKGCTMIKENNEEFYEFLKNWNHMNDAMKEKIQF